MPASSCSCLLAEAMQLYVTGDVNVEGQALSDGLLLNVVHALRKLQGSCTKVFGNSQNTAYFYVILEFGIFFSPFRMKE